MNKRTFSLFPFLDDALAVLARGPALTLGFFTRFLTVLILVGISTTTNWIFLMVNFMISIGTRVRSMIKDKNRYVLWPGVILSHLAALFGTFPPTTPRFIFTTVMYNLGSYLATLYALFKATIDPYDAISNFFSPCTFSSTHY
jgi:hypothetical protein